MPAQNELIEKVGRLSAEHDELCRKLTRAHEEFRRVREQVEEFDDKLLIVINEVCA